MTRSPFCLAPRSHHQLQLLYVQPLSCLLVSGFGWGWRRMSEAVGLALAVPDRTLFGLFLAAFSLSKQLENGKLVWEGWGF